MTSKSDIQKLIKDIKKSYTMAYKPLGEEVLIRDFFNNIYRNGLEDKAYNVIWFFISLWSNESINYTFYCTLDNVQPKTIDNVPLYYIVYRLAKYEELNINVSPNIFLKPNITAMNTDDFVKMSNTLFIDIDHIDFSNMNQSEIEKYLIDNYKCLNKGHFYPHYIVKSGKGIHLYFLLKNTINISNNKYSDRKKYIETINMLQKLFNSDEFVGISHYLRFPTSWNCKGKYQISRKTEIFEVSKNEIDIDGLRDMLDRLSIMVKRDINKTVIKKNSSIKKYSENSNGNGLYKTGKNRLTDLTRWLHLHKDDDIEGRRNIFFYIYINASFTQGLNEDFIKDKCYYLNDLLSNALKQVEIDNMIKNKKEYRFTNKYISDVLNFTDEEKKMFICNY